MSRDSKLDLCMQEAVAAALPQSMDPLQQAILKATVVGAGQPVISQGDFAALKSRALEVLGDKKLMHATLLSYKDHWIIVMRAHPSVGVAVHGTGLQSVASNEATCRAYIAGCLLCHYVDAGSRKNLASV